MKQTIFIDKEPYEVDRTVAGTIDEMQDEIEKLRGVIVRLAVFVGGDPCWCRYAKTGEHTEACRVAIKLRLWPRPTKGKSVNRDFVPWK